MSGTEKEEELQTLPVGHPEAGYVGPDLSETDHVGTLPDAEKEWAEERDETREEQVKAVEQHEDEVAKKDREEKDKELQEARDRGLEQQPVTPPPTQTPPVKKGSSSSS